MFGKQKEESASRVPLEEQISKLAECGLKPLIADVCTRAAEEWGREQLENEPYDLILTFLGSECEDASGQWRPVSDSIWHLDTECICDADDYVSAAVKLATLAHGDLAIEDVRAFFEDTAWLEFRFRGQEYHWDLEVSDDWIDTTLIDRFTELLVSAGSPRRYCVEKSEGQDCLILCPTREEFERLTKLTPLEFEQIGPEW